MVNIAKLMWEHPGLKMTFLACRAMHDSSDKYVVISAFDTIGNRKIDKALSIKAIQAARTDILSYTVDDMIEELYKPVAADAATPSTEGGLASAT